MSANEFEAYRMRGTIQGIAEDEFYASFSDDTGGALVKQLYDKYIAEGSPKNAKAWIRNKLKDLFRYVSTPPQWVESGTLPAWPFINGRPMVFITQVSVPPTAVSEDCLSPGCELYVFGARDIQPDGTYRMRYQVIEQDPTIQLKRGK